MAEVTMPRLSDTMQEGTIGRWLKKPGDPVERGDILAEIETDKATMELEAYESGTLQEILVQEGQAVPIGTPIAMIGEGAARTPSTNGAGAQSTTEAPPHPSRQPASQPAPQQATAPAAAVTPAGERVKASPLARRVAANYGIDLRQVAGSGPGGRIIRDNVEAFFQEHGAAAPPSRQPAPPQAESRAAAIPPAPQPADISAKKPLSRMRHAIATRMSQAKHGMPHIYVTSEIDMGAALELRAQINESGAAPVKVSVNDMVVKAVARALRDFPILNSSYVVDEEGQPGIVEHPDVNVNIAVAVDDGLIVPVVRNADTMSLGAIAARVKDLAARTREGTIKQSELEGGTFTVSNLGMYDVVEFAAIITPPQAAVLAVSSTRRVPVVRGDQVTVADMMNVTISADHRVTDGATAARYVQRLKELLEAPLHLLV